MGGKAVNTQGVAQGQIAPAGKQQGKGRSRQAYGIEDLLQSGGGPAHVRQDHKNIDAAKVQGQKIHPETAGYQRGADLKKLVQEQQCRQKPETAFSLSLPPGPITASQQKTQEKAGPQPG